MPWKCHFSFPVSASSASKRVGIEIIADAVIAIKIADRRTGGRKDQMRAFHPAPCRASCWPRRRSSSNRRPGLVARLAGMRNGVEHPALLAGVHVKGADVAGRGRRAFRGAKAHHDHVAPDQAGPGQRHADLGGIAVQPFAQVDAPAVTKAGQRLSGSRVERIEITAGIGEQPPLAAVCPTWRGHAAARPPSRRNESARSAFRFRHPARWCPGWAYRHRPRHRSPADGSGDRPLPPCRSARPAASLPTLARVIWERLEKRRPPSPPYSAQSDPCAAAGTAMAYNANSAQKTLLNFNGIMVGDVGIEPTTS